MKSNCINRKKYFLFVALLLSFLINSFSVAKGQTYDELKTKVNQLESETYKFKNEIKNLKKTNKSLNAENIQLKKVNDSLSTVIELFPRVEKTDPETHTKLDTISNDIKDPIFLEYLLKYCDMDNDGVLTQWDAENTYIIDIGRDKSFWDFFGISHQITSIDGIERFINLKRLVCSGNAITQINLSKNVLLETFIANGCELEELELPKSDKLIHLECNNNSLYTIDLRNNPNLQNLDVSKNKMTAIDIAECSKLKILNCSRNELINLNVSKNVQLQKLVCSNNKINRLSFTHNTSLDYINCSNNKLTEVDVRNGIVEIKFFDCRKNKDLKSVSFSTGYRILSDKRDAKTYYK